MRSVLLLEAGEFFDACFGESRAYKEYVKDLYYLFERKKEKKEKKKKEYGEKVLYESVFGQWNDELWIKIYRRGHARHATFTQPGRSSRSNVRETSIE